MGIHVVNHIINMNNYFKKNYIEKDFVHNHKIVVLVCFVHMHMKKKILNVN